RGIAVAWLDVPLAGLDAGRNDRGEVRLQEWPVLARGRMLDVRGEPARGAVVETTGSSPFARSEPTDAEGGVVLRGRAPGADTVQLRIADGDWFFAEAMDQPVVVHGGGDGCTLRVERAGRVLVRLVPPVDAACPSALQVQAVQHGGNAKYTTGI